MKREPTIGRHTEDHSVKLADARRRLAKLQNKLTAAEQLPPVVLDARTTLERTVPSHEVGLLQRQIAECEAGIAKLEAQAEAMA